MKEPDRFLQTYNTQIAVQPGFQLIVGQGQTVTPAENDKRLYRFLPGKQKHQFLTGLRAEIA